MPNSTEQNRWTPDRVRELRESRGQTQEEFGLDLFDMVPASAQKQVSRIESGKQGPGTAARRTLARMAEGEI